LIGIERVPRRIDPPYDALPGHHFPALVATAHTTTATAGDDAGHRGAEDDRRRR